MSFTNPIVGGQTLIRNAIQSRDFVAGVSGWQIRANGSVEFNDASIRGDLLVIGSNNSYLRILSDSGNPQINFRPEDFTDPTVNAAARAGAVLVSSVQNLGLASYGYLSIYSPDFTKPGASPSLIRLIGDSYDDTIERQIQIAGAVKIDPGTLEVQGTDMGKGLVNYAGDAGDSPSVGTTESVVLTLASATYEAGRAYEVRLHGRVAASAGGNNPIFLFRKTNTAGQQLITWGRVACPSTQEFTVQNPNAAFIVGASDVTAVLVVTLTAPAGTVIHKGRRWVSIHDVGLSTYYPDAAVLV